jgi:RNA polymerase sigma-70 factor (ECF subfamily)
MMIVARGSGVNWGPGVRRWSARWLPRISRIESHTTRNMERRAPVSGDSRANTATSGGVADDPFAAFVAEHEAPLFAYLWRSTGDEGAAYDLRQETFIRAWRHFARVRGYERPLAWLYRVATNLALNYRRDLRPAVTLVSEDELAASDPAWQLAERDLVRATLLALPQRERQALALRSGQGLSCEEVAQALGVTPAAARTLLWRARERFRELYQAANSDADRSDAASGPERQGGGR